MVSTRSSRLVLQLIAFAILTASARVARTRLNTLRTTRSQDLRFWQRTFRGLIQVTSKTDDFAALLISNALLFVSDIFTGLSTTGCASLGQSAPLTSLRLLCPMRFKTASVVKQPLVMCVFAAKLHLKDRFTVPAQWHPYSNPSFPINAPPFSFSRTNLTHPKWRQLRRTRSVFLTAWFVGKGALGLHGCGLSRSCT